MTLQELVVKISANTKDFDKKMAGVRKGLDNAAKGMAVAGGVIAGALGVSVKKAMDFQSQMANVSTMLDKNSMSYMPKFSKGIQDMASKFGESSATLSEGLYNILSASVAPAKALGVLKVSVESAAAGLTDTGTSADALTTILNSYGLSADKAGMVSDKLFAIVKRGKTTFGQLAPSIGRVASTAATAGVSLDELGAMVATLTRAGISTDEAMTSVNGVIASFLKPAEDAKKVAAKFGLELNSNTLKTLGFTGVIKKLNGATAEQLATIFPNIRALKGVAAALQNAKGMTEDYQTMLHSTGLTQEAFAKQSDTASFQMKQLQEKFMTAAQELGTTLLPIITDFIERLNKLVGKFNALPKPVKENIAKFALLASATLLVGAGILKLVSGLSDVVKFIYRQAIPAVIKFQLAIGPIGWAIEGIIAVIALLFVAWKHDWGGIREKTEAVWKKIKPIFDGIKKVFNIIIGLVKDYIDIYVVMWKKVQPIFHHLGKAFNWIGKVVADVFGVIQGWFDDFKGWIDDTIGKIVQLIDKIKEFLGLNKGSQGKASNNAVNGEGGIFDLSGIPGHAEGGYFTTPHLAWIAERGPEYVVPEKQMKQTATAQPITLNISIGSWLGDEQGIKALSDKIAGHIDRALGERRMRSDYYALNFIHEEG